MKTRKLMAMFCCTMMFALMGMCFTSCGDDDEEYTEMTIEVDAVKASDYHPQYQPYESLPGMSIRIDGKKRWSTWSLTEIKGFTYEEGYYYRLVIGLYGSTYKLIKVLEKTPCSTSVIKDGEKYYVEKTYEVDAVKNNDYRPASNPNQPGPGMSVREVGKDTWQAWNLSAIEGFTYEEGYYYRLQVGVYSKKNPNVDGDSYTTTYELVKVLEKTPRSTSVIK